MKSNGIISINYLQEQKQQYRYKYMPVLLRNELGRKTSQPCIVLYCREMPIAYPGFERWLVDIKVIEGLEAATFKKRAYALCNFLNFLMWKTRIGKIHEVDIKTLREWLIYYRTKEDGKLRSAEGWNTGVAHVFNFLSHYHKHNCKKLPFRYDSKDLITKEEVRTDSFRGKRIVKTYNHMSVKGVRDSERVKKNRVLLYGYLDVLLLACKMYDPEIVLGVALQSYAGIREGEVVNLTYSNITLRGAGFGTIGEIILDLLDEASFAQNENNEKSGYGSIKRYRKQLVYPDFNDKILGYIEEHQALMGAKKYENQGDAPVFLNKWGRPMSVRPYTRRVKVVFYEHFLPMLKALSNKNGTWMYDAPYIEMYERDCPGAHMFRHWFTMYLATHACLRVEEIAKWRGDKNSDTVTDYLHINKEIVDDYKAASHSYQMDLMEEIL